jgi:hypothetical protein
MENKEPSRFQGLFCLLGFHLPDQLNVSNKSLPIKIAPKILGYVGVRTGESQCLSCKKKLMVRQEGIFGPITDLGAWKIATRHDLRIIENLRRIGKWD